MGLQKPLITRLLKKDHEKIRALCDSLQEEIEKRAASFEELFRLIHAHFRAEEYVLYSCLSDAEDAAFEPLRQFALEGYEEHDLIDRVLQEMLDEPEIDNKWRARLSVVAQLLNHHLSEEEEQFFPKMERLTDREELIDLGVVYERERDVHLSHLPVRAGLSASTTAFIWPGSDAPPSHTHG